ncbi:coiled-coil domain-containing protein [Flectobacillus roseus]|uniref:BZIP transcription factor n=1 Tax=Flectobacillus roseus TaxID=502259 RepID=A0ABT6YG62_9BACT|nr:bZIP transcription factor [Flectobacillus roseus]MDI9862078.1 bZIP transcription factor [Flectobacillus roseus]NBA74911.1 bZIP transcription factor [Emticicia sp. ODNR4P]
MKRYYSLLLVILGITFSTFSQTITAPYGQSLTINNPLDIAGGSINIMSDSAYKIGGKPILSIAGIANVLLGDGAGFNNQGSNNIFIGKTAGFLNASGFANTFIGESAGYSNTTGNNNMFLGTAAGLSNAVGYSNTFIGVNAGRRSLANGNAYIGTASGINTITGNNNTGLGTLTGQDNVSGSQNTFVGFNSGSKLMSGDFNTFIGALTGVASSASNITNATAIGANTELAISNSIVLGNNASVGIGTNDPVTNGAKLVVVGAGNNANVLQLRNIPTRNTVNGLRQLFADDAGNLVTFQMTTTANSASEVKLNTNSVTNTLWTSNESGFLKNNNNRGVVIGEGINSLPEGYNLYVSEGILTEQVKVALKNTEDWADHVFSKKHQLMPLQKVEDYIKKHQHLPNIPSAAEMVISGNDLHQTDTKLLEKIEELTLYMIELKKENQQMKQEIESLKKRQKRTSSQSKKR